MLKRVYNDYLLAIPPCRLVKYAQVRCQMDQTQTGMILAGVDVVPLSLSLGKGDEGPTAAKLLVRNRLIYPSSGSLRNTLQQTVPYTAPVLHRVQEGELNQGPGAELTVNRGRWPKMIGGDGSTVMAHSSLQAERPNLFQSILPSELGMCLSRIDRRVQGQQQHHPGPILSLRPYYHHLTCL